MDSPAGDPRGRIDSAALVIARSLRRAVRLLRFPAFVLLLVPVLPLAGGAWLAWGATDPARWLLLGLVAVAAVVVVAYGLRVRRYLRAVDDVDGLAAEIRAFVTAQDLESGVLERFRALAERGGVGLIGRLRALWGMVSLPGHLDTWVESHPRVRWFVPPTVTTSWALILAQLWVSALSWVGFLVLTLLRLAALV